MTKAFCWFFWYLWIAYKLWEFEIFNLASEVKVDLGGQSSLGSEVANLINEFNQWTIQKKKWPNILNSHQAIDVCNFQFDLTSQSWPLRSKVICVKSCSFNPWPLQKKNYLNILNSLRAIDVRNFQFGLRGQIWPRMSKFI